MASTDPSIIISTNNCNAAAGLTAKSMADLESRERLELAAFVWECIKTGDVGSAQAAGALKAASNDIYYEWPQSAGNSQGTTISMPYTLDENYMKSNLGIGGCEITIDGLRSENVGSATYHYLDMSASPTGDVAYCELGGIANILDQRRKHGGATADTESLRGNGDTLVGINIITNRNPGGSIFGFQSYSEDMRLNGTLHGGQNEPPLWRFDESERQAWSPGTSIRNVDTITQGNFFFGYTTTNYGVHPVAVELVFIDVDKLGEHGETVGITDGRIHYSKYFAIN